MKHIELSNWERELMSMPQKPAPTEHVSGLPLGCATHDGFFFDCMQCNSDVWANWPKVCACKREYTAQMWCMLPFLGEMIDDREILELRNCMCGSTLAVRTFVRVLDTPP